MPDTLTTIPAARVPLIDERTGLISIEWYRFLSAVFNRTGGSGGADGDRGDIVLSDGGLTFTIKNGVVQTENLGGDITALAKTLLTQDTPAEMRVILEVDAASIPYDAAVPANWASNLSPEIVAVALDQLANRIKALETGREAVAVGGLYLSLVDTDPEALLGYGEWAQIAAGQVLVGLDSGDTDFDTVRETGGSKTVAVGNDVEPPVVVTSSGAVNVAASPHTHGSVSVVQPYYVCYIWERTA